MRLTEQDRNELLRRIYAGLAARGAPARKSDFFDNLSVRCASRVAEAENPAIVEEDEEQDPPSRDAHFLETVSESAVDELMEMRLGEFFPVIEKVVLERDDASFQEILRRLETKLKIRGLLYRRGLDPEREYPSLWSKIWEALPKWDGRDFRAYVAQLVRNYCLDDLKRRKKAPGEVPEQTADARPMFRTEAKASTRDALEHVLSVIADLEREGDLAPIDGVIFALLTSGRSVADISAAFTGAAPGPFAKAVRAIAGKKKLDARQALAIRYLLDGLEPDEVAVLSRIEKSPLTSARNALKPLAEDDEHALLIRSLAREGIAAQDAEKATSLTPNAINLRINRARLKVWMALCDRADAVLRKRGAIDDVDLAIVQHRCSVDAGVWCRMYKDRTCKRERTPAEVAARSGLNVTADQISKRMDDFREKILDGLGRAFPDYNSCLNERKPDRGRA